MQDNKYVSKVFLAWLDDADIDPRQSREWIEHQQMQVAFLMKRGLRPHHRVLDVGCGPLRLGSALLPFLSDGWYFGHDINAKTLALGERMLQRLGVSSERCTLIASGDFSMPAVEQGSIDVAFSNSLFSHLTMNSILCCLLCVASKLKPDGVYYSTFFSLPSGATWDQHVARHKWGHDFFTAPCRDPYHYSVAMLADLARHAGFTMEIDPDFGHPTQTMAVFRFAA